MGQEESDRQESEEGHGEIDTRLQSFAGMVRDESLEHWLKRKEEKRSNILSAGHSKRAGLNRSTKPLKKSPLAKVSKKQKKKVSSYAAATVKHYNKEENQSCFLCGCSGNLSIHHKSKRGKNIDNQDEFVTLCLVGNYMDTQHPASNHSHSGGCHGWVEGNKSIAREIGLIND